MKRMTLCLLSVFTLLTVTSCGYAVEEVEGNVPAPAENMQAEGQMENAQIEEIPSEQPTTETAPILEDGGQAETGNMQDTLTLSKEELYYRCMNTLLFMDQISGHTTIKYTSNSPTIFDGKFAYDFRAQEYYTISDNLLVDDLSCCLDTAEVYGSNGALVSFNNNTENAAKFTNGTVPQDTYKITKSTGFDQSKYEIEVPKDSEAAALPDGWLTDEEAEKLINEPSFYQTNGHDPTGAHELAGCFIPQEMSSGFMSDFSKWEISGTEELDSRTCAVVKGTTTESYGKQMGLASFEIWVDQETGVWLWYEGYDENGEVQSYVYTDNMQFGSEAQQPVILTEEMLNQKMADGNYEMNGNSDMDVQTYAKDYLGAVTD